MYCNSMKLAIWIVPGIVQSIFSMFGGKTFPEISHSSKRLGFRLVVRLGLGSFTGLSPLGLFLAEFIFCRDRGGRGGGGGVHFSR